MSATGYGALWPNPLSFDQRYAITFDRVPRDHLTDGKDMQCH
jgi:hypothetical protein